ncbi:DNA-binding response regulator [Neptunitalea chrysea]|uniref:DNA-binding response regulator n=1 Tax=Neptunitalea chrysea TaxID=1647581 RepID=A0A9W6EVJ3_9FLAO|nr:LytTR family DNA-binding domain-containing protein [Neptunitalea chrysea]GLB51608.1 DNA-binding response regulator [Neptunitalea chrysea]
MELNVVIIEDEPANARNLQYLINEIDDTINIVKVLGSVKESVEWLPQHLDIIDLLFMDIRLGDGISFDILEKITVTKPIIFATAYEEYALKAFNTYGIAYVLKPYERDDLEQALDKYKLITSSGEAPETPPQDILRTVLNTIQQKEHFKKTFLVHYQNKLIPIAASSIAWFYSKNEITKACTVDGKQYFIEDTLEHLGSLLNPDIFFRANRQFIVNKDAIEVIDFYFNGRLLVKVTPKADEQMIISKAKASVFKSWLDS